jgi:hypothetical protein
MDKYIKYKKKYLNQFADDKSLFEELLSLNNDDRTELFEYLHNYFSENKKVCGKNIIKYLKSCEKDLNKVNIKLLINKTNPAGFYCGSGSVLSELYEEYSLDEDSIFIYGCLQNMTDNFWKNYKDSTINLYHNLYGNKKKTVEQRDLLYNILSKHFEIEWNKSNKQAISIKIPDNISKKDYDIFVKQVKKLIKIISTNSNV